MAAMKIAQSRMALQQKTAEALAELVDEDVPEAMISGEVNARLNDFVGRIERQGADMQAYLDSVGKTGEELVAEFRQPAEQAVRVDLALRAVAEAENLWPDDEAIDAELARATEESDQDVSKLRARLVEAGQMSALRADLAKRAALEWLTENVELVDEDGETIDRDLLEFPETDVDGESE
jgi:trigger factor